VMSTAIKTVHWEKGIWVAAGRLRVQPRPPRDRVRPHRERAGARGRWTGLSASPAGARPGRLPPSPRARPGRPRRSQPRRLSLRSRRPRPARRSRGRALLPIGPRARSARPPGPGCRPWPPAVRPRSPSPSGWPARPPTAVATIPRRTISTSSRRRTSPRGRVAARTRTAGRRGALRRTRLPGTPIRRSAPSRTLGRGKLGRGALGGRALGGRALGGRRRAARAPRRRGLGRGKLGRGSPPPGLPSLLQALLELPDPPPEAFDLLLGGEPHLFDLPGDELPRLAEEAGACLWPTTA